MFEHIYTDYQPRTVLAGGITRLGDPYPNLKDTAMATPSKSTKYKAQIPAMPSKEKIKFEDYSTPYAPCVQPIVITTGPDTEAFSLYGMTICNDPLPEKLNYEGGFKYQAIFEKLKPGDCIRCSPDDISKVRHALQKHFKRSKIDAKVKTIKHYPDDRMGRVWWFDGNAKSITPA